MASSGIASPTMWSTGEPAAPSSSGTASSTIVSASPASWSSGSTTVCRPWVGLGTSRVKTAGPRAARSRTASMRAGVAAVFAATTRTRAGAEDSMRDSLRRRWLGPILLLDLVPGPGPGTDAAIDHMDHLERSETLHERGGDRAALPRPADDRHRARGLQAGRELVDVVVRDVQR